MISQTKICAEHTLMKFLTLSMTANQFGHFCVNGPMGYRSSSLANYGTQNTLE